MLKKQAVLRLASFNPGSVRMSAEDLRRAMARRLSDRQNEAFFNYAEGAPSPNRAAEFCFLNSARTLEIISKSGDKDSLEKMAEPAKACIKAFYKLPDDTAIKHTILVLQPEITFSERPRFYRLKEVAIKKSGPGKDPVKEIQSVFMRMLDRCAIENGIDIPPESQLDFCVHELRHCAKRLKAQGKETNQFFRITNALVSVNLSLKGAWQIGNLQSRGYGQVLPAHLNHQGA